MMRTLLLALLASLLFFSAQQAYAQTKTQAAACGFLVPPSAIALNARRYSIRSYQLESLLRFFRKVYGSPGKRYSLQRLFSLPQVTAYHMRSLESSSRWIGINIAFHHAHKNDRLQIFIHCRK
jgi:hypothetical protein